MFKFRLALGCECDDRKHDWHLLREFTWPLVPRINEIVVIGGNGCVVTAVSHDLSDGIIEVESWDTMDVLAHAYLNDPTAWQIEPKNMFVNDETAFRDLLNRISGRSDFHFVFA